jgi:flagellin
MTFTATNDGDTTQSFTATLSETELTSSFGAGTAATLTFKNGGTTAFSFTVDPASSYDTTSATTMHTLASGLSEALTLSATGGVDAQEASYGLYASMTGATSVELEAGMESVSFSNGVKVNFNELSTAAVSTANTANLAAANDEMTLTFSDTTATPVTKVVTFDALTSNGDSLANGALTIASTHNDTDDLTTITLTDSASNVYTAVVDDSTFTGADAISGSITFKATSTGTVGDITLNYAAGTTAGFADTLAAGNATASDATATVENAGLKSDTTFGTANSTFDVETKSGDGLTFQVGANEGDAMTINIDKMDANTLGVGSARLASRSQAEAAIATVDAAINSVSAQRAALGAIQNRLEYKIDNLSTSSENLTSAESQIRDVDMAKEMTNFTNANILQQAATAMLAQANSLPQNVLSLIGG